jgi:hypothetical protein
MQTTAEQYSGRHDPIGDCRRSLCACQKHWTCEGLVNGSAVDHPMSLNFSLEQNASTERKERCHELRRAKCCRSPEGHR